MSATERTARRYASSIGFAVTGRLARKPEWDGRFQNPEIGLDGEYRVLADEGGNAYYVNGWQCVIIDPDDSWTYHRDYAISEVVSEYKEDKDNG